MRNTQQICLPDTFNTNQNYLYFTQCEWSHGWQATQINRSIKPWHKPPISTLTFTVLSFDRKIHLNRQIIDIKEIIVYAENRNQAPIA